MALTLFYGRIQPYCGKAQSFATVAVVAWPYAGTWQPAWQRSAVGPSSGGSVVRVPASSMGLRLPAGPGPLALLPSAKREHSVPLLGGHSRQRSSILEEEM